MQIKLSPALTLVVAIMAGACMDASIKFLAQTNHVLLVAFERYLFGGLFSFALWAHSGRPRITAEMWRAHGLRGVVIAGAAIFFFWSLTVLPLAEAITLTFVYPLFAPFVARAMLGERVRARSVWTAIVGFVGVGVIAAQGAPTETESPLHAYGVAAVLASAVLFGVSMILLRDRAQKDGPIIVGLMASVTPGLILALPTLLIATPPNLPDWPFTLLLGAFAALFMYLIANAYGRAEAQQLAPIHYTELIWASFLGYLIFHETPRVQIYMGAVVIIGACLYAAFDERRSAPKIIEHA